MNSPQHYIAYAHHNRFTLTNLDAIEALKEIQSASIDCIVTDYAYESLEKHRKVGTTTRLTNAWFSIFPNIRIDELMFELFRVLKNNRHCYMYCDSETMFLLKPAGEKVGFKFWKPIVWDKESIGMGYHYRGQCEFVLFFEKGKRKLNNLGVSDVLPFKRIRNGYPTEKPVELSKIFIANSTIQRELVLDPFCGSGSVGEAALSIDRRFYGNDISLDAVNITRKRCIHAAT